MLWAGLPTGPPRQGGQLVNHHVVGRSGDRATTVQSPERACGHTRNPRTEIRYDVALRRDPHRPKLANPTIGFGYLIVVAYGAIGGLDILDQQPDGLAWLTLPAPQKHADIP